MKQRIKRLEEQLSKKFSKGKEENKPVTAEELLERIVRLIRWTKEFPDQEFREKHLKKIEAMLMGFGFKKTKELINEV
tara:strand:+ start:186 stop:419 length:234 start_codon:yes stop_codon:yes gene_type:complete